MVICFVCNYQRIQIENSNFIKCFVFICICYQAQIRHHILMKYTRKYIIVYLVSTCI